MPTLRQAAKDDIMLIHELALQAFPATYRDLLSQEQMDFMMDWMYSPANLEKQMEEGHVYFIASHQGEDCGYLSVQPEGPGVFHLQKIYCSARLPGAAHRQLPVPPGRQLHQEHPPGTVPDAPEREPL